MVIHRSRIHEARQLYDMNAVLGLTSNRKVIVCPLPGHPHHNNTPSFSISVRKGVQRFRCFGACGASGDVVDLAGYMNVPNYDPSNTEHVMRALAILEGGYKITPPQREPRNPALINTVWQDFIPPGLEVIEYSATRGLTSETLKKFGVGQSSQHNKTWMTIPTFHMGRLMGIKMRNLEPVSVRDRYMSLPGSVGGLFNANAVYYKTEPLLIVKAEIPVMLLDQYGIPACAPTGGESSNEADLFSLVVWSSRRIVVADNDRNHAVRQKMDEFAKKRADIFHAAIRRPPEAYKDIDQWILAEPDVALAEIRSWIR